MVKLREGAAAFPSRSPCSGLRCRSLIYALRVTLLVGHEAFTADTGPMPPDDAACVGRFMGSWTAVRADLDSELLPIVAAHEFGHRLGLQHTDVGVMAEVATIDTRWILSWKAVRLLESRGLREQRGNRSSARQGTTQD